MSPEIKNDLLHLLSILESIEKIQHYSKGINDAESFFIDSDQLRFNACLTLFVNIGETSKKISKELKGSSDKKLWSRLSDFRNKIAHEYPSLDLFIVFNIIINELPALKDKIINIIKNKLETNTFDVHEYNVAKESPYYKHIDFSKII